MKFSSLKIQKPTNKKGSLWKSKPKKTMKRSIELTFKNLKRQYANTITNNTRSINRIKQTLIGPTDLVTKQWSDYNRNSTSLPLLPNNYAMGQTYAKNNAILTNGKKILDSANIESRNASETYKKTKNDLLETLSQIRKNETPPIINSVVAGNTRAILSISKAANTSPIGFTAEYGINEAITMPFDSSGKYTIDGLKNGTTYKFKVVSNFANGYDDSKPVVSLPVIPKNPPTVKNWFAPATKPLTVRNMFAPTTKPPNVKKFKTFKYSNAYNYQRV